MALAKTQDGKSVTVTEKEIGNGLDTSPQQPEQGAETSSSKPGPAAAVQQGIGIGSVSQQPVCESCHTKDAKIMELEEALKNLKAINSGTGNRIEASSATIDDKSTEFSVTIEIGSCENYPPLCTLH
jgi:hypothetical protein